MSDKKITIANNGLGRGRGGPRIINFVDGPRAVSVGEVIDGTISDGELKGLKPYLDSKELTLGGGELNPEDLPPEAAKDVKATSIKHLGFGRYAAVVTIDGQEQMVESWKTRSADDNKAAAEKYAAENEIAFQ